jgi:SHS2 domain-containing protein
VVTRARDPGPLAREIEHAADLGLEVDAPTLPALFERAGLATLALMVDLRAVEPRDRVTLAVDADDRVALLHDWLQTLLVRLTTDGFAPAELAVADLTDRRVRGWATGERVDPARHALHTELKGVSYHELAVRRTPTGWSARIIVDV